ncbi:type VI secretion system protein TssA [Pseudomonas gingeri NCPPB 3146 = LMG 5327]|uniref:Type VI secretion system protein TssA n=2 Tax=Pseudomonas gingeri TaxID=117681 RepID=A0A7Y8CGD4_9PSED|nr:type VI secretion system protein TssA [Pseudomonas gingeri]NWC17834.1 type VI secretion system protein TssA [Pseudomonas gingeri]PNQ94122.1 type VI secretion system protein TssA [Pseudomonas gingeri NCPPB 3146 = LMG 5327]
MSLVIEGPPEGIQSLLLPIDPEQPAGHFDSENETYQAIDQEMVKLGGLHEAGIDWAYIDTASCLYLTTQCKHFRILGHLHVVWLRTRQWTHWVDALDLLAGLIEGYWDSAHPKPGPTGYLAKRKQVRRLLENLEKALPALERSSFAPIHQWGAEQALASLRRSALAAKLDQEAIEALQRQLERYSKGGPAPQAEPVPASPNNVLGQAFFVSPGPLPSGNEREQRRVLLNMAEQINQQDPYEPTGYQLRRFGLWSHLQAAPAITRERRTELMAVPRDIVETYQQALINNALEPALLLRIEKSVAASPYWLNGSYLAANVASRLAMDAVAAAIRQSCERFVCRLPALMELCFSDGTPFADTQTQAWIRGGDKDGASSGPVQEYAVLREELVSQIDTAGVEVVLSRVQALLASDDAPRHRAYATVIAADLLASRGLSWLADDLYANVARQMRDISAEAWEPQLYQKTIASSAYKD